MPRQTDLQRHLHQPHTAQRTAIISALADTHDLKLMRAANRLAGCCTTALLVHDPESGQVRPWLPRCGSRLCPFCGKGRSARVAEQLHEHIQGMESPRHITLTFRSRKDPLSNQLQQMRAAFCRLRRHKDWTSRVTSGLYTIEVTRNIETGLWHPHLHVIVDGKYFPQALLAKLWSEVMDGGQHVWITKVDSTKNAAWELAKYVGKPPAAKGWTPAAIVEFAMATARTRMMQTFGTLHGKAMPETEEDPADPPETRFASIARIAYLASTGIPLAQDLAALLWSRWPMLRSYLQSKCPDACTAEVLQSNPGLECPRPPPLGNGRWAPHTDPNVLATLDNAIDLTLLLAWAAEDSGHLHLQHPDVDF